MSGFDEEDGIKIIADGDLEIECGRRRAGEKS